MKITGIIDDYEETANCFVTEEVFEQAGYSQADYGCGILYYQYRFWFASDRIEEPAERRIKSGNGSRASRQHGTVIR